MYCIHLLAEMKTIQVCNNNCNNIRLNWSCRKLKATIDEYTTRVGQQAVVLIVTPGKPQNNYKVFGARPLESVVR